jgi:uncharacterized protein
MDERERAFINLEVEGPLHVVCQRCLQPVTLAVDVAARFLVVETEPQADAVPLDEDAYDVIVGSREFDVLELVEDEVILSLPIVPKHDQCPDVTGTDAPSAPAASERISPFADLRKMTKQRKS